MPRKKIFLDWEIPYTVVNIVRSVCADYDRRAIAMQSCACDVIDQYRALNDAVDRGLSDLEVGIRKIMLDDICSGRGYGYSPVSAIMTKNAYYHRKRKAIHDIAEQLKLI